MNTELDSLELRVTSDAATAASGLDKLEASMVRLRAAARGGSGLASMANALSKLNTALSGLEARQRNIASLASALNSLSNVKSPSLNKTANQITKINTAVAGLNVDGSKLRQLAESLSVLGDIPKATGLNSTLNTLRKIPEITRSLSSNELRKFGLQMQLLAKYLRPVSQELSTVSRGLQNFSAQVNKAVRANKSLAASNKTTAKSFSLFNSGLTGAISGLALFGFTAYQIVNFLADCVTLSNEYIENVNLFQVSMGEYYNEAFEYAMLVSDRLGIDPSQWMRYQGVFMSMAKGFGLANDQAYLLSEGLTELTYDISSLYNEPVEQAALRLQSGLAGEIEPVRRLGIPISEAAMKEYARDTLGITENVENMTEAEKSFIRALMLMEGAGRVGAIGDFAKTLESPANAIRVLNQQITQLKRAIGNVMIPILIQVIPYVQAFVEVLTELIQALAVLVGFTMPEWDTNSWSSGLVTGADDATDAIGGTAAAVKKLQDYTLGIDELNIIDPPDPSSGGAGAGGVGSDWINDLEIPNIWDKDFIASISSQADKLKDQMRVLLGIVLAIGTAFLAWKIGKAVMAGIQALQTALLAIPGIISTIRQAAMLLTGQLVGPATAAAVGLANALRFAGVVGVILTILWRIQDLWKSCEAFRVGVARIANVFRTVFLVVNEVLAHAWESLKEVGQAVLDLLPPEFRETIESALGVLGKFVQDLNLDWVDLGITIAGIVALFIPGGQVLGVILLAFEAISVAIRAVGNISDETWSRIRISFNNFIIPIRDIAVAMFDSIIAFLKGVFTGDWNTAWAALRDSASRVLDATRALVAQIFGVDLIGIVQNWYLTYAQPWFTFERWLTLAGNIKSAIVSTWDSTVGAWVASITTWWENDVAPWFTLERWQELGRQALEGLFQGLAGIGEKISDWGEGLIRGVKNVLGIHSPSTRFEEVGQMSVAGLQNGFSGISVLSSMFSGQIALMQTALSASLGAFKGLVSEGLAYFKLALLEAELENLQATNTMTEHFRAMAAKSNAAIQSIINYLNSIPRSITTVHTIITRNVTDNSGSSSSRTKGYATGGFPETGQLFFAREAGPELVGTIQGNTAVANNQQIVEGIAAGVAEANMQQNSLLREQNELLRAILAKEGVVLDGKTLLKSVKNAARESGATIMVGGVV